MVLVLSAGLEKNIYTVFVARNARIVSSSTSAARPLTVHKPTIVTSAKAEQASKIDRITDMNCLFCI
jgi:hypothetical protein